MHYRSWHKRRQKLSKSVALLMKQKQGSLIASAPLRGVRALLDSTTSSMTVMELGAEVVFEGSTVLSTHIFQITHADAVPLRSRPPSILPVVAGATPPAPLHHHAHIPRHTATITTAAAQAASTTTTTPQVAVAVRIGRLTAIGSAGTVGARAIGAAQAQNIVERAVGIETVRRCRPALLPVGQRPAGVATKPRPR